MQAQAKGGTLPLVARTFTAGINMLRSGNRGNNGWVFRAGYRKPSPLAEPACRPANVVATLTRLTGASFVTFLPVRGSADDCPASLTSHRPVSLPALIPSFCSCPRCGPAPAAVPLSGPPVTPEALLTTAPHKITRVFRG